MSDRLKLMALDIDDLTVISAHLQDAVLKSSEINYVAGDKLMILPVNRFAWEAKTARRWLFKRFERRLSVLHFARVESVKTTGINRADTDQVLELLAITFTASDTPQDPSGTLVVTFAGGATMHLQIECIEAQLGDLGAAWSTPSKPYHGG